MPPFCALLRSFVFLCLRSSALICVFLRPTAFRTTAFGNSTQQAGLQEMFAQNGGKTPLPGKRVLDIFGADVGQISVIFQNFVLNFGFFLGNFVQRSEKFAKKC